MLAKLLISIGLLVMGLGIGITIGQYEIPSVQAINVVGGEIITRSETNADFRVFKSSQETVEVLVKIKPKNIDPTKDTGELISKDTEESLQFLVNSHQSLQIIQDGNHCPTLAEWEAAGGVPGGNVPNPIEFPLCDPDVLYDPARCTAFWEDREPGIDHPVILGEAAETLTFRPVMVGIEWDGTIYNLTLRDPRSPANYPDNC